MGVPETDATTLSESNRLEYLVEPLKKNILIAKTIANNIPIFEVVNFLNIFFVASTILVSISESNYARNTEF